VVCRHFWPEHTRVNDLCDKLAAVGYKVDVLCGQPSAENGDFMKGYGSFRVRRETHDKINIYRTFDVKKGTDSNISIFLNYITFPIASLFTVRKLKQNPYSAILVYQLSPVMMCVPAYRIGKDRNIPVYVYVAQLWPQHVCGEMDVQSHLFRKFLMRLSMHYYRKASKLIVTSPAMKKYFADRLGMMDEQLPIVTMAPEQAYLTGEPDDSLREKLAGTFTLLIPGDPKGQLSVKTVIEVAKKIRESNVRNIRFMVTGFEERIRKLQKAVNEEGLADDFYFEGRIPRDEIGKYLQVADILLAIVKPEGENEYTVPLEMIDLIAAGKPVVASLSEYTREMIREAGCGYTTEPEDAAGLYQAIMDIYRMPPEKRKEMGEAAAAWQQAYYDRDANAEKMAWIIAGEAIPGEEKKEQGTSSVRKLWDI